MRHNSNYRNLGHRLRLVTGKTTAVDDNVATVQVVGPVIEVLVWSGGIFGRGRGRRRRGGTCRLLQADEVGNEENRARGIAGEVKRSLKGRKYSK